MIQRVIHHSQLDANQEEPGEMNGNILGWEENQP